MFATFLGVFASYLVGAIPFGYIAGRVLKGIDVRNYGSGNVGATNVLRTLGKGPGIVVLLLDVGKGLASVLVIGSLAVHLAWPLGPFMVRALCGAAAIIGHDFSVFLRFTGGKGVATGLGVFLGIAPVHTPLALVAFAVAVDVTRYVSVGSLALATSLPVLMVVYRQSEWYVGLSVFWLVSVIYTHRENIRRLLRGEERRIGRKVQGPREVQ